jgi:hypothetical protein
MLNQLHNQIQHEVFVFRIAHYLRLSANEEGPPYSVSQIIVSPLPPLVTTLAISLCKGNAGGVRCPSRSNVE